jgi:mRNA interferase MazF
MIVEQGDIFWIDLGEPVGSEPDFRRPHVVIQNNLFNQSRIRTVVMCVVTSNMRLASAPGNVRLERGEAGLSRESVVNVSRLYTVDKAELVERIGTLSRARIDQILDGVRLVIEPLEL